MLLIPICFSDTIIAFVVYNILYITLDIIIKGQRKGE